MTPSWTLEATRDVEEAFDYLAEVNPEPDRMRTRIVAAVERLTRFPLLGRPGKRKDTREWSVRSTPYFVVYRAKDTALEVLRVMHESRNWPANDE